MLFTQTGRGTSRAPQRRPRCTSRLWERAVVSRRVAPRSCVRSNIVQPAISPPVPARRLAVLRRGAMADTELVARVAQLEAEVETYKAKARRHTEAGRSCAGAARPQPRRTRHAARRVPARSLAPAPAGAPASLLMPGPFACASSQAEAAAINAEQAGQALEQRYTALSEEHGKARRTAFRAVRLAAFVQP